MMTRFLGILFALLIQFTNLSAQVASPNALGCKNQRFSVQLVPDDPWDQLRHLHFPEPIKVYQGVDLVAEFDFDKDHRLVLELTSSQIEKGGVILKGKCYELVCFGRGHYKIDENAIAIDKCDHSITVTLLDDGI